MSEEKSSTSIPPPSFDPPLDHATPGTMLGQRYRIEHAIGEGGMGLVVRALDTRLQRPVAIKLLHPEYAGHTDVLERFGREARVIAQLRSPYVVDVLDVSVDPRCPYLVLEFLDGESLESRIERLGPLPIEDVVRFGLQVVDALEEAHAVGIVHRDIKPANVFLTRRPNGEVVAQVLDFGTARFYEHRLGGQRSATITKQFETFGSPAYMPPEQISSALNTDERSDVWALGTVLYEATSGHIAFEGLYPDVFVVIATREPTPLETLRPDVPPELSAVIAKCLRKDKAARYQNMGELRLALQAIKPKSALAAAQLSVSGEVTAVAAPLSEPTLAVNLAGVWPAGESTPSEAALAAVANLPRQTTLRSAEESPPPSTASATLPLHSAATPPAAPTLPLELALTSSTPEPTAEDLAHSSDRRRRFAAMGVTVLGCAVALLAWLYRAQAPSPLAPATSSYVAPTPPLAEPPAPRADEPDEAARLDPAVEPDEAARLDPAEARPPAAGGEELAVAPAGSGAPPLDTSAAATAPLKPRSGTQPVSAKPPRTPPPVVVVPAPARTSPQGEVENIGRRL